MKDAGAARGMSRRLVLLASAGALAVASSGVALAVPAETMARWNSAERIRLWKGDAPNGGYNAGPRTDFGTPNFITNVETPELRVFRPAKPNGRALLSIPGGAYRFVSIANEGVDIADAMTAKGYTVFVLVHRLPGEGWNSRENVPLQDAQRAVRIIRASAQKFGFDPDMLYAVGFSAGGHLGATLATAFDEDVYKPSDSADSLSARPRGIGMIYPVISHETGVGHAESTRLLLGPDASPEQVTHRSPALHVTQDTPPTFLIHSMDDGAVPVENSYIMLRALRDAKRPVEAHFFEEGGHGFGLGPPDMPAREWITLFANWIDRQEVLANQEGASRK